MFGPAWPLGDIGPKSAVGSTPNFALIAGHKSLHRIAVHATGFLDVCYHVPRKSLTSPMFAKTIEISVMRISAGIIYPDVSPALSIS